MKDFCLLFSLFNLPLSCKRNDVIPCSITEQSTTSYVLTVLEHSHIQSDVIACTVL